MILLDELVDRVEGPPKDKLTFFKVVQGHPAWIAPLSVRRGQRERGQR